LVDHTVARIIEGYQAAFKAIEYSKISGPLKAIYKWGCDGSSGHSTYRQRFSDPEIGMIDESIFSICMVPLQILDINNAVIWQNERPSSTRFCRPIKISFEKETADLVRKEVKNIEQKIEQILPSTFQHFKIVHEFHLTMIDGKIFNSIAEASMQVCGICGATPSTFNNLKQILTKPPKECLYKWAINSPCMDQMFRVHHPYIVSTSN